MAQDVAAMDGRADDPRPTGATTLVGEQTAWPIRVGDHRVLHDVFDEALVVTVVRAGHRREVYDRWALAARGDREQQPVQQRELHDHAPVTTPGTPGR